MKLLTKYTNIKNNRYTIIAASHKGFDKAENQDNFGIFCDDEEIIIIVADGLGSAKKSRIGSKNIVEVAYQELHKKDNYKDLYLRIFNSWKNTLKENINYYDTTIKFLKIKEDNFVCGGVGDGWIAINSDSYHSFTAENIFSNATDSILSPNLVNNFKINSFNEQIKIGLISTDGFSEDMNKDSGKEFLAQISSQIQNNRKEFVLDLKNTLNDWPIKTNGDDKTVVIIRKDN